MANSHTDPTLQFDLAFRQARMVASSMVASLTIFIVVVELLQRGIWTWEPSAVSSDAIRFAVYGVAVLMVLLTNVIKGFATRAIVGRARDSAIKGQAGLNMVMMWLAEAPALLGFVGFIVWGQYADFYVMVLISVYLVFRHYPRYDAWRRVVDGGEKPVHPA